MNKQFKISNLPTNIFMVVDKDVISDRENPKTVEIKETVKIEEEMVEIKKIARFKKYCCCWVFCI